MFSRPTSSLIARATARSSAVYPKTPPCDSSSSTGRCSTRTVPATAPEIAVLTVPTFRAANLPFGLRRGRPPRRSAGAGGGHGGHRRPDARPERRAVLPGAAGPAASRPLGEVAAQRPAVAVPELLGAGRPVGLAAPARADGRSVRARARLLPLPARHGGRASRQRRRRPRRPHRRLARPGRGAARPSPQQGRVGQAPVRAGPSRPC